MDVWSPRDPALVNTIRNGPAAVNHEVLDEVFFHALIAIERKRTERSRRPFLLMLLDTGNSFPSTRRNQVLASIGQAMSLATRETDVTGWYSDKRILGVMFAEIIPDHKNRIVTTMLARVGTMLRDALTIEQLSLINVSVHFYPEEWEHELSRRPSNPALYPDLSARDQARRFRTIAKRTMDIFGGGLAFIVFAPLFALIALAIKATSKGPVFFRQERVGEHGRPFVFLKFRSMRVSNDVGVHQQWFRDYISGRPAPQPVKTAGKTIVKLTNDPRVTRLGRILRRTSLDELPQFINVLRGDMSLVGPRPPIPYEVDAYQVWHRGRVLEAKPGITGLWQVTGRGRVTFDEMVRLDLRYARTWSLWLDAKILLQTPRAVLFGEGAY